MAQGTTIIFFVVSVSAMIILLISSYITIMSEKTTSVSAEKNDVWLRFQTEIIFLNPTESILYEPLSELPQQGISEEGSQHRILYRFN